MRKQVSICSIVFITLTGFSQKQLTHVATKANNSCNGDCTLLDLADLNDNPAAVIWVTPVLVNGTNLNPHPIGVYYFKNKWSIFNLDQKSIPEGSKFAVEYSTKPDQTHFQYSLAREDMQQDGSALIDHPALNNNPSAKFTTFPSWNPDSKAIANREEINIGYNTTAGKWSLTNINKKNLLTTTTYNIVISSGGNITLPKTSIAVPGLVVSASNSNTISGAVSPMYVMAWADKIKLPGDNSNLKYPDGTELHGFDFSVSRPAAGRVGTKTYEPITIKISTGVPITIPFFEAFLKKRDMDFTIDAFTNSTAGRAELNYTIKLSGASIISFKQTSEERDPASTNLKSAIKYYDEIRIIFTKIEFIKDNVTVEDIL